MNIQKYVKDDTKVIMADGSLREIKSIMEKEFVMGIDNVPKEVIATSFYCSNTVKIIPSKGRDFICSDGNLLTLVGIKPYIFLDKNPKHITKYKAFYTTNGIKHCKGFMTMQLASTFIDSLPEDIFTIHVNDYIKRTKIQKGECSLYHIGLNYPEINVPIDPYMIGYWLGDGCSNGPDIVTADKEIIDYFDQNLGKYGLKIKKKRGSDKYMYSITGKDENYRRKNVLNDTLKNLNLIQNKHIPDIYKYNSRSIRLALLAGLIDSDGYIENGSIEIAQKNFKLSDDIQYLCFSLGFMVTRKEEKKGCNYKGNYMDGYYQRMLIFGDNMEDIPTIIARKKIIPRKIKKRATCLRFEVEPVEREICCGIQLEGDAQQYLQSDFLVL